MFAALRDLPRRPARLIRGPKPLWAVVSCLNVLGSLSYLIFGRRKDPQN
ncbi:PLDc N-terminal domain-containing protein [Glutamicibacter nicotianae]